MSIKLQYEILSIGLKNSIGQKQNQSDEIVPYEKFANFFVDDKSNLMDIMRQLGEVEEDQERIQEELFLLLSFFILTIENRKLVIKNILVKNSIMLCEMFEEFQDQTENEDDKTLMGVLSDGLTNFAQKQTD